MSTDELKYWWHIWGAVKEDCWATVVLGPSIITPEAAVTKTPPDDVVKLSLNYLHSWDHEPSDKEKDALTPEEYIDE